MKKGRGKRKGNSYEIKISRLLSRWYKPNDSEDYFWRTSSSGAKSTITGRGEASFMGDIMFLPNPDVLLPVFEAKDRKKVTFNNINESSFLPTKYYHETVEKCKAVNVDKPVWVIFKLHNFKDNYIYLREDDWNTNKMSRRTHPIEPIFFDFYIKTKDFTILNFEEFLRIIHISFILKGEE